MDESKQLRWQHMQWRAGFGPTALELGQWDAVPEKDWWGECKRRSAAPPSYLDPANGWLDGFVKGVGEIGKMEKRDLTKEQRRKMQKEGREKVRSLNLAWLAEMVHSKAQLREKMAFFWHGHFASKNINVLYQQQLLHLLRTHALGNFRDLLHAVSKSAAMLAFLNNNQNRKRHPNENFAREVMELFTLGRGNYTETDIKEAARAFTGWNFTLDGTFQFNEGQHDKGSKIVLGVSGLESGESVLDTLLDNRQTAHFIARKVYRFLVTDAPPPEQRIAWLGDRFFENNYAIEKLLDDIFTSNWFFEPENMAAKIKSPVELWVGIRRFLPMTLQSPDVQLLIQKALGQVLFNPPNVAGWPGGRNWIDASSLMLRLRIPQVLYAQNDLDIHLRGDDDELMGQAEESFGPVRGKMKALQAELQWEPIVEFYRDISDDSLADSLARALWQVPQISIAHNTLRDHTLHHNRLALLTSTAIQLMATPEYQVC